MKILVAEDDPDTLTMYSKLLNDAGHEVIMAKDGEECLVMYSDEFNKLSSDTDTKRDSGERNIENGHTEQQKQQFDAVILDHRMPKMNGLEVAKKIISINPHQRIIIASSYDGDIFKEAADYFSLPIEILQKPFSRFSLLGLLKDDPAV